MLASSCGSANPGGRRESDPPPEIVVGSLADLQSWGTPRPTETRPQNTDADRQGKVGQQLLWQRPK